MAAKRKSEKHTQTCPYCEEEILEASFPYCQTCKIEVFYCPKCRKPISKDKEVCPNCGAVIRK